MYLCGLPLIPLDSVPSVARVNSNVEPIKCSISSDYSQDFFATPGECVCRSPSVPINSEYELLQAAAMEQPIFSALKVSNSVPIGSHHRYTKLYLHVVSCIV